jgi:hypothetical protein
MAGYTTGQAGVQTQKLADIPAAYETDALDMARSQRLAELLSSGKPAEGQMISGRYVKPSWTQHLNSLVQSGLGAYYGNKAETEQQALAKKIREGESGAFADFMATKQGAPAQAGNLPLGTTGQAIGSLEEPMGQYKAPVAATRPNPLQAYSNLYADPRATAKQRDFAWNKLNADPMKVGLEDTLLDPHTYEPLFKGAGKNPASIETAAIVLGLDRKPRDQWTAQDRAMIDNQIQKTAKSGAANLSQKDFSNSLSLRKEFNNEPIYKGHQEIKSAWNTINVGLNQANPAGDLAAATKFMKLLDPTSVVRESELLMAMKASGALDRLYNYAQMKTSGTLLTPKQRGEFRTLANEFYQTATNQYNAKYGEYADLAKRNNLNPLDIGKPETGIHNSQWGEVKVVEK